MIVQKLGQRADRKIVDGLSSRDHIAEHIGKR